MDGKAIWLGDSLYKRAIALNEKHVPSPFRMANLSRQSSSVQALEAINTVASQEPPTAAGMLRAELYPWGDKCRRHHTMARSAVELNPNNADALAGIAACIVTFRIPPRRWVPTGFS